MLNLVVCYGSEACIAVSQLCCQNRYKKQPPPRVGSGLPLYGGHNKRIKRHLL